MPKLGESITEGTIVSWSVKAGDRVKEDDVLFEVTTAKVSAEIPSPVAGKVVEIYFQEGDTVAVGTTVALIELSDEEEEDAEEAPAQKKESPASGHPQPAGHPEQTSPSSGQPAATASAASGGQVSGEQVSGGQVSEEKRAEEKVSGEKKVGEQVSGLSGKPAGRWYSPAVLQLAGEASVSPEELDRIPGTGYEGRLSKKDIQEYIRQKKAGAAGVPSAGNASDSSETRGATPEAKNGAASNAAGSASVAGAGTPQAAVRPSATASAEPARKTSGEAAPAAGRQALGRQEATTATGGDEVREMDRVRRIIADHMVLSKKVAPHVTTFVEADVTRLVKWRTRRKDEFLKQEGVALTYMPAIAEAAAVALKEFPQVNASVDGYRMILKKQVNIGIAVSLPDGNLIVPVIHGADKMNLAGLAVQIDTLAAKARSGKLGPDDLQGGTFTITNFGTFRNLFATPIINQPESAILGVGYIEKKPAVVETPEGDAIAVRHKMFLSLSYDHRIIDGSLGGAFLRRIADYLENWDRKAPAT